MSETETKIEIEDVLASIRRLVSREAGAVQTRSIPHRSAVPEPDAAQDVDCLVLTPAHRVSETEPPFAQEGEDFAETPAFVEMDPEAEAGQGNALPQEGFAGPDWPHAEPEPADAVALAVVEAAGVDWAAGMDMVPPDDHGTDPAVIDDVADFGEEALVIPSPHADFQDDLPAPAPAPAPAVPRAPTEAEMLLAEAEAALAETGAMLEDATSALAATPEAAAPADAASQRSVDIVDELARLESTIAELEAAVAESGADFETEQEHSFRAEIDHPAEWTEAFEAAATAPDCAPADTEAAFEPDFSEPDLPEPDLPEPDLSDPDLPDPDLTETAWIDPAPVGMDWAEAALRLAERGPRRLTREEAELVMPQSEAAKSSYAALCEELAREDMLEATALPDSPDLRLEDATIDEATLREIVAQMVRAELRGALGERITQNVRKLVRREIQRALMGQDFD